MCYTIFLSTSSTERLNDLSSHLFHFSRLTEEDAKTVDGLLRFAFCWYLEGQNGSCSCHFRHAAGNDFDFAPPVEWHPEDADDIAATGAVYDVLKSLVENGHRLDLVDLWESARPEDVKDLTVNFRDVPRDAFRFFENCRFILV